MRIALIRGERTGDTPRGINLTPGLVIPVASPRGSAVTAGAPQSEEKSDRGSADQHERVEGLSRLALVVDE